MEMTWCWRNLFFSFSRAIFRETLAWERSELSYELERVKPPFPLPRLPLVRLRWPIYILYFFFAFFSSGTRPRLEKLRRKRGVKTVNVIVKNKSTTIFHGLWSETKAFFEHSDIISMVDKSTDHAKLLFICQIVSKNHSQRNFSVVYYICIKNIADLSRFNTIYLGF